MSEPDLSQVGPGELGFHRHVIWTHLVVPCGEDKVWTRIFRFPFPPYPGLRVHLDDFGWVQVADAFLKELGERVAIYAVLKGLEWVPAGAFADNAWEQVDRIPAG